MRPTPTRDHAEGMLAAIVADHDCTVACTGTVTLGDGKIVTLTCPWDRIDLNNPAERRLVASVYANEAHHATGTDEEVSR